MRPNYGMELVKRGTEKVRYRMWTNGSIPNRWRTPSGDELKGEYNLVMKKQSKLPARQRLAVLIKYGMELKKKQGDGKTKR